MNDDVILDRCNSNNKKKILQTLEVGLGVYGIKINERKPKVMREKHAYRNFREKNRTWDAGGIC